MVEIEGFESIISQITLAKELHEIGRVDIVEQHFFDEISWDSYFENIYGVLTSIFSGYHSNYDDNDDIEDMVFKDACISNYFIHAWEYGKLHNLPYDQNPYLTQAQSEVGRWLNSSTCVGWKLLGYTKTRKKARQSKLIVQHYTGCSCNAHEYIAYGLVKLYSWFVEKCDEFDSQTTVSEKSKNNKSVLRATIDFPEVMAA